MGLLRDLEVATHETFFQLGLENIEFPKDRVDSLKDKVLYFKRAMEKFGVELVDEGFLSKIKSEDVVEIYMPDMKQVYRSLNFFDTCSYKPKELFNRPWYELFHRSPSINEEIFGFVEKVLSQKTGLVEYPISSHYLKETSGQKNVTRIDLGYAGTLKDKQSQNVFGFASTLKASHVSGNVTPLL